MENKLITEINNEILFLKSKPTLSIDDKKRIQKLQQQLNKKLC